MHFMLFGLYVQNERVFKVQIKFVSPEFDWVFFSVLLFNFVDFD